MVGSPRCLRFGVPSLVGGCCCCCHWGRRPFWKRAIVLEHCSQRLQRRHNSFQVHVGQVMSVDVDNLILDQNTSCENTATFLTIPWWATSKPSLKSAGTVTSSIVVPAIGIIALGVEELSPRQHLPTQWPLRNNCSLSPLIGHF